MTRKYSDPITAGKKKRGHYALSRMVTPKKSAERARYIGFRLSR